ncbi:MAG: DUF4957 domain-containing protein [Porphyromonadaceae bacterium]|nr:DUF4957 domain-containing protein [Porphyromonadaceae bacterium]
MKLIKYFSIAGLFAMLFIIWTGCEHEDIMTLGDISIEDKGSSLEIIVEPDDGIDRVNSLANAINANGDATYVLRRGGTYYVEGKTTCNYNVVIKAEPGTGDLPRIQPIMDATGAMPSYIFEMYANSRFENVYILSKDAASGNLHDRAILLNKDSIRLELVNSYLEGGTSSTIRIQVKGCKVYITNSLLRNVSNPISPSNGRLVDTRGKSQDSIVIRDSYCYNNTGQILRHDGSCTKYFELSGNTFWHQANVQNIDCPFETVIENNIFANYAWKTGSSPDAAIWDVNIAPVAKNGYDPAKMKITVRNNNFFNTADLEEIFSTTPLPVGQYRRTKLMTVATEALVADGRFVYKDNISEVLTFTYRPPLPVAWIKYFITNSGEMKACEEWFDVDEDGIEGIKIDAMYSFKYPMTSKSATASTTGGPIGAQW